MLFYFPLLCIRELFNSLQQYTYRKMLIITKILILYYYILILSYTYTILLSLSQYRIKKIYDGKIYLQQMFSQAIFPYSIKISSFRNFSSHNFYSITYPYFPRIRRYTRSIYKNSLRTQYIQRNKKICVYTSANNGSILCFLSQFSAYTFHQLQLSV